MTFTHPKDAPEGHKWQTRDGREARIYAWDHPGEYPIHGAVLGNDEWSPDDWTDNGCYWSDQNGTRSDDLIDAPRKHGVWVNFYPDDGVISHSSRHEARASATPSCLARKYIEFEEGEGL